MKNLSLLFLLFLLIGCNPNDDAKDTTLDLSKLSGKIVLPSNLEVNTEQWTANSTLEQISLNSNEFELDIFENSVSTILVTDGDKVKMMGYRVSGENYLEVTIESTAKALMMCTPLLLSIDENYRFSIINTAATFPEFTVLKQAVETNLSTGNDLFDENNETVFNALGNVIKKMHDSGNLKSVQSEQYIYDPVHFEHDKRKLAFWNNHIAYSTVIGIYKDGQRIEKIEIDGVDAFPTSVGQLFLGILGEGQTLLANGKISESYLLEGDGNFEIKIRTGLPFSGSDTEEYEEALKLNLIHACKIGLSSFLPRVKSNNNSKQCLINLVNEIYSGINGAKNLTAVKAVNYAFKHTIQSTENFYHCAYGEKLVLNAAYFGYQSKLFTVFEQYATKFNAIGSVYGNIANITFLATQWAIATPAVDICLVAEGDDVHTCCDGGTVTDIDGNVYSIVTIGNQCWMQSNLNVSHYRNGDAIPQVQDIDEWGAFTTAAWCYGSEWISGWDTWEPDQWIQHPEYGKLYNLYAVTDPRGLAPEGWHIATYSEWQTLYEYLGGANVAGGKMKTTTDWKAPNTGASNGSGFNGFPGGCIYYPPPDGFIAHPQNNYAKLMASWWSSEGLMLQLNYNSAELSFGEGVIFMTDYINTYGNSIRCIKD